MLYGHPATMFGREHSSNSSVLCWQLSKFLPNNTKEQQAYKAQRVKTTMLYGGGMDAVAQAAGNGNIPTDPIAAALAAHGK